MKIYQKLINEKAILCNSCGKEIPVGAPYYLDSGIKDEICEQCHGKWEEVVDKRFGVANISISIPRAMQLLEDMVRLYAETRSTDEVAEAQAVQEFIEFHFTSEHLIKTHPILLELKRQIKVIFSSLTPREQSVLSMRFGLDDGVTYTLEEVGKKFGVTRERVRQIEAKVLEKIKKPTP